MDNWTNSAVTNCDAHIYGRRKRRAQMCVRAVRAACAACVTNPSGAPVGAKVAVHPCTAARGRGPRRRAATAEAEAGRGRPAEAGGGLAECRAAPQGTARKGRASDRRHSLSRGVAAAVRLAGVVLAHRGGGDYYTQAGTMQGSGARALW